MTEPIEVPVVEVPDGVSLLISDDEEYAGGELCAVLQITEEGITQTYVLEICPETETDAQFVERWEETCESTGWPFEDETAELSDDD